MKKNFGKIHTILKTIRNKRAKIVIKHILKHGYITTEELEKKYGYNHPPRAARDVRETGIPLETYRLKSSQGKSIAAYRFGDLSKVQENKLGGRRTFPKAFKQKLYEKFGGRCGICAGIYEERYLQIDHRIPYEVVGDDGSELVIENFMLVCGSCNRAKSWSCEHCINWKIEKNKEMCLTCYWAKPENYTHVALNPNRRIDLNWEGKETEVFDKIKSAAQKKNLVLQNYIKDTLREIFK